MLHALHQKKARWEVFRSAGEKVPLEDVVTSTVFGPLEFLNPAERSAVLRLLFDRLGLRTDHWRDPLCLSFWKKRPCERFRDRGIEPDLVISDAEGPVLIIEIKWNAALEDDNELAAQWMSLSSSDQLRATHLFLVRKFRFSDQRLIGANRLSLITAGIHQWPLLERQWYQIARALEQLVEDRQRGLIDIPDHIMGWARKVYAVIRHQDQLSMCGWGTITYPVETTFWSFQEGWFAKANTVECAVWRFDV